MSRARHRAQETACLGNLAQIGKAANFYAIDFDDHLPPTILHLDLATRHDDGKNGRRYRALLAVYGMTDPQWFCPLDPITNLHRSKIGVPLQPLGDYNSLGRVDCSYQHSFRLLAYTQRGQGAASLSSISNPSGEIHIFDAPSGEVDSPTGKLLTTAHRDGANALYFDGHTKRVPNR